MFDDLTDRLQGVLQQVKGENKLTAANVDAALAEIRRALIEADVNLTTIKTFLSRVRSSSIGEKVVNGVTPSQKFIQIVTQELTILLGSEVSELNLSKNPSIILLLGLQGAGKTTTAAKLAYKLKKENKSVLLVGLDLSRPAAIDQLEVLAKQVEIDFYRNDAAKNMLELAGLAYEQQIEGKNYDAIIFDTAGRLQIDSDLMAELLILEKKYKPQEKLLVIDSLIGQEAANVAQTFNEQIGITGSILTKMDGDSRGGAALSVVESTGQKIKFIGISEKIDGLDVFDPGRIAERILGFGDIVSLVQSIEEKVSKKEVEKLEAQLKKGQLNFALFLQMQRLLSKLGGLGSVFNLMGLGSQLGIDKKQKDQLLTEGQKKLKNYEFIIESMTLKERENPYLLQNAPSRVKRIASGCGCKESTVKALIAEFMKMKDMMGMIAPMMGGGIPQSNSPMGTAMDLLNSQNKMMKQQKKEKKKNNNSPFGGGAFMKF